MASGIAHREWKIAEERRQELLREAARLQLALKCQGSMDSPRRSSMRAGIKSGLSALLRALSTAGNTPGGYRPRPLLGGDGRLLE